MSLQSPGYCDSGLALYCYTPVRNGHWSDAHADSVHDDMLYIKCTAKRGTTMGKPNIRTLDLTTKPHMHYQPRNVLGVTLDRSGELGCLNLTFTYILRRTP
jgi:hypothetical protein